MAERKGIRSCDEELGGDPPNGCPPE